MTEAYSLNGRSGSQGDYGAVKRKREDKVKILPDDSDVSTIVGTKLEPLIKCVLVGLALTLLTLKEQSNLYVRPPVRSVHLISKTCTVRALK